MGTGYMYHPESCHLEHACVARSLLQPLLTAYIERCLCSIRAPSVTPNIDMVKWICSSGDVLWPTRRGRASRGVSCRDSWVAAARRSNIFPIPRSPLPKRRRQVRPTNCRIRYWAMSSNSWTSSKAESSRRHERDSSHDACRRGNTCGRSDTASGLGYEQHEVWDKCEEHLRWEKAGLVAQRSWAESRMRRSRNARVAIPNAIIGSTHFPHSTVGADWSHVG